MIVYSLRSEILPFFKFHVLIWGITVGSFDFYIFGGFFFASSYLLTKISRVEGMKIKRPNRKKSLWKKVL